MSVVRTFLLAIALVLAVQCEARSTGEIPGRRPDQTANKYKSRTVVDLTHLMNGNVPKWPLQTIEPPVTDDDYYKLTLLKEDYWGPASDKWLSLKKVQFFEHMGTHLDAPSFAAPNRQDINEIPVSRLIGPGVIINVVDRVQEDLDEHGVSNYAVTVQDIEDYEAKFGKIPAGAIVVINTGWGRRYPRPELVYGTSTVGDVYSFNFPSYSVEACQALLDRQVSMIGTDGPSVDPGQISNPPGPDSPDYGYVYPCKHLCGKNEMPMLQFVANLDNIPAHGHFRTTIFVGGMKHEFGRAGPARVLAEIVTTVADEGLPEGGESDSEDDDYNNNNGVGI